MPRFCERSPSTLAGIALRSNARASLLVCALGLGMFFVGCSSDTEPSRGTAGKVGAAGSGVGGSGGTGSGSGGAACLDLSPCGGDVLGTWQVSSSCLALSDTLDLSPVGAPGCSAPVTGFLSVTGTFTANADGTYSDNTVTTGEEHFTLSPSCLVISSTAVTCEGVSGIIKTLGFASVTCTPAGAGCTCSATVNQPGSIGVVSVAPSTSNNYSRAGNQLTLTNDAGDSKYAYCAQATQLNLTPQGTNPKTTGSIVLEKRASGAGGSSGTAGFGGTGGASLGGSNGDSGGSAGRSGVGGMGGNAGASGAAGSGSSTGPCDIYSRAGNPCVAAHSTVRALLGAYSGKLYQVRNAAGMTKDILTLAPGGIADGLSQDAFCMGTTCVVTVVYDQSGKGNDLWYQGSTQVPGSTSSTPAKATSESLSVSGHKVYSLYINANNSYWVDASKSGIALGAQPEGMYMVTSGKHFNGGCCFDYGNSETDRKADGSGAMDALNLSSITAWGTGAGNGPWVMADLEYGVFAQNNTMKNQNNPSQTAPYVTAILKNNGTSEFALRGSDASAGKLSTYYKGALPGGWSPMKKQGAIVLGSGGDCCKPGGGANLSVGTFYEGCIVTGYPSDATEDAVQANIVAAGYGKQ